MVLRNQPNLWLECPIHPAVEGTLEKMRQIMLYMGAKGASAMVLAVEAGE